MKIIGITGSIGCGKTYLADIIRKLGFGVYNPDIWVRDLYKKESFLEIIKDNFPAVFEKDVFNKRKLRNLVFDDKKELKKLEALIHPLLKEKLKQLIRKNSLKNEFLFLDVALLFEMNWDIYCDYIIVADVDKNIQKQRVMKRDNVSETDFENIIKNQESQEIKKEKADIVINTGYSYGINKVQLIKFIEEIL